MRHFAVSVMSIMLAIAPNPVCAWELATHGLMTLKAFQASGLSSVTTVQRRLGIDSYTIPSSQDSPPFASSYVDMGSEVRLRREREYETRFMPKSAFGFQVTQDKLRLDAWLMRGAIREDDTPAIPLFSNDDPVNAVRPLNHFFDPVHNLPLTLGGQVAGTRLGRKNPDWALGTSDAFLDSNAKDGLRQNHFSVFDAREAMWRALTLRDGNQAPVTAIEGVTGVADIRKAYWATTFRALGDLVHMIQDMAQPQHTRNEPHSGIGPGPAQQNISGHGSAFEQYVEARASGKEKFDINVSGGSQQVTVGIPQALSFDGYPITRFARYSDYFSTSVGSTANAGYGIADYSNRRFFTQSKNLGHPDFTLPSNNPLSYVTCKNPDGTDAVAKNWDGTVVPGSIKVSLLCAPIVQDELNPSQSATNVPLTSKSAWDQFLVEQGLAETYHLIRENYDAQADLLIPRAVAYSAGLIDYFFRGQLYVAAPTEGVFGLIDHGDPASNCKDTCGFTKIKLRAANSTPDITPPGGTANPQGMTGGVVVAVSKYRRNNCYNPDLAGEYHGSGGDAEKIAYYNSCVAPQPEEITVSDALNVSSIPPCNGDCDVAALPYTFNFQSPIPINAASLSLQLVYRGVLGSESDAVVVETVDVTEPSFHVYMNASDYIKLGQSVFTPAEINADANLRTLVRPTSCIVNDQLSPTCFPPVELNFSLLWGDPAPTTTGLTAPLALSAPKQFSRFAMIAPPGVDAAVNQSASPCLPSELSRFPGKETQERFVPVGTPPSYQQTFAVSPMSTARAVNATYAVGCVVNGDGVLQGPDDRFVKMAPLVGAELTPKPLSGFSFGN